MVVVGGDGTIRLLADVWLFEPVPSPTTKDGFIWQWRPMRISMAGNAAANLLVPTAGHSLVPADYDGKVLVMWGGLRSNASDDERSLVPPDTATRINLEKRLSENITFTRSNQDAVPPTGRVMHGLATFARRGQTHFLLFGGCSLDGTVATTNHLAAVTAPNALTGSVEFRPMPAAVQQKQARRKSQPAKLAAPSILPEDTALIPIGAATPQPLPQPKDDLRPLPPAVSNGTPLSGRIIDSTEVGHFVSVIIAGREYKGVLVLSKGRLDSRRATLDAKLPIAGNGGGAVRPSSAQPEPFAAAADVVAQNRTGVHGPVSIPGVPFVSAPVSNPAPAPTLSREPASEPMTAPSVRARVLPPPVPQSRLSPPLVSGTVQANTGNGYESGSHDDKMDAEDRQAKRPRPTVLAGSPQNCVTEPPCFRPDVRVEEETEVINLDDD
jgi:hypothetical protein